MSRLNKRLDHTKEFWMEPKKASYFKALPLIMEMFDSDGFPKRVRDLSKIPASRHAPFKKPSKLKVFPKKRRLTKRPSKI